MTKNTSLTLTALLLALSGIVLTTSAAPADSLETSFQHPPASARPWVYWFPLNGNLTKAGITADLEAMARVGIGGVLYMETDPVTAHPRGRRISPGRCGWR